MSSKKRNQFFEIGISPKKAKTNTPEAPLVLILAPFSPVPKVDFSDVKIYTRCTKSVKIKNPTENEIEILLQPPDDVEANNFFFSATNFSIPQNSEDILEIAWSPEQAGSWRYNISVKNLSGNKKFAHIVLLANCTEPKRAALKKISNTFKRVNTKNSPNKNAGRKPKWNTTIAKKDVKKAVPTIAKHQNEEFIQGTLPPCNVPSTSEHRKTYSVKTEGVLPTGAIRKIERHNRNLGKEESRQISSKNENIVEEEEKNTESYEIQSSSTKQNVPKKRNISLDESESPKKFRLYEPIIFPLSPTSPVPCVEFNDVKRYKSTVRQLVMRNSTRDEINIEIIPSPEMSDNNFAFSANKLKLPPRGERVIEISWSPHMVGSWQYTIPITHSNKFKNIFINASCIQGIRCSFGDIESSFNTADSEVDLCDYPVRPSPAATSSHQEVDEKFVTGVIPLCDVTPTSEHCKTSHSSSFTLSFGGKNSSKLETPENKESPATIIQLDSTKQHLNSKVLLDTIEEESKDKEQNISKMRDGTFVHSNEPPESLLQIVTESNLSDSSYSSPENSLQAIPPYLIKECIIGAEDLVLSQSFDSNILVDNLISSNSRRDTMDSEGPTKVNLFDGSTFPSPSSIKKEVLCVSPIEKAESLMNRIEKSSFLNSSVASSSSKCYMHSESTPVKVSKSIEDNTSVCDSSSSSSGVKEGTERAMCFDISPPKRKLRLRKGSPQSSGKQETLKRKMFDSQPSNKVVRRSPRITPSSSQRSERWRNRQIRENSQTSFPKITSLASRKRKLTETNYFLMEYLKLDPFGPTAMEDPFAKHVDFSKEWLDKQELELVKWLNTLLTPPSELETVTTKVDVAKLWEAATSSKTVKPAPNRDTVSTKFHSNPERLDCLRKAAKVFIQSAEIVQVLGKLHSKISKGLFGVKDDINIFKDQGARRRLCELVMCYNPLWLRIGLEAIYGRNIPIQNNKDVRGLIVFINKNFLTDENILAKHSYSKVLSLKMSSCKEQMNEFVVFKFLTLLFILDQFKKRRLIPYDPCLFRKDSEFKESEMLLNEFTKHFLKCVSHMKKVLNSIGFKLTHKQTYLDEFDFAVNTRQDLRDGVRLTRAIETIFRNPSLCSKLRTPPISRLQKIHNVKVALDALKSAKFEIVGDILPSDIVEGHREKMMSLLWQILHRFLVPRYESSAKKIQIWWRKNSLKFEIYKRIKLKKTRKEHDAATKIQAFWRGYLCRCLFVTKRLGLKEMREKRLNAAILIQKWLRGYSARINFLSKKQSTLKIQGFFRKFLDKKHSEEISRQQRDEFLTLRSSAIVIQRHFRAYRLMKSERKRFLQLKHVVTFLQLRWRFKRIYLARLNAAIVIESAFRRYRAEKYYREVKKSVCIIQTIYRTILKRRETKPLCQQQRLQFLMKKKSALVIQAHFRAFKSMKMYRVRFWKLRRTVEFVQNRWRFIHTLGRRKKAATTIQRAFRSYLSKKLFLKMNESACKIQKFFRIKMEKKRMLSVVKRQREEFLKIKSSTCLVQKKFRMLKRMKVTRSKFLALRRVVVFVQFRWRFLHLIALRKKSAIIIQRKFKSVKAREIFLNLKENTSKIQKWYRAILEKRQMFEISGEIRNRFLVSKQSAIVIQTFVRRRALMKRDRLNYLALQRATSFVQRRWLFKKFFLKRKQAAIKIQSVFRSYSQRKSFHKIKTSTCRIQKWYLCILERRKLKEVSSTLRKNYLETKKSALTLQKHYRALLAMKYHRSNFLALKRAAVFIQCKWRYKKEVRVKTRSVIVIQKVFRGYCARKRLFMFKKSVEKIEKWYSTKLEREKSKAAANNQRQLFVRLRQSTLIIQQYYRGYRFTKEKRTRFLSLQRGCIFIQNRWRFIHTMKIRKCAANTIQRAYKTYITRKRYLSKKISATIIQKYYRIRLEKKKLEPKAHNVRVTFLKTRHSVILIQNYYRRYLKMKEAKKQFQEIKRETIFIQNRWQFIRIMKKKKIAAVLIQSTWKGYIIRKRYLIMKNAAEIIKKWYKKRIEKKNSLKIMEADRNNYLKVRASVICIQKYFKACLEFRTERQHFLNLRRASLFVQCRWRYKKKLTVARKSVSIIVKALRNHISRKKYLKRIESAIKIQRWFRDTMEAKKQMKTENPSVKNVFEDKKLAYIYYWTSKKMKRIQLVKDLEIIFTNFDTVTFLSSNLCEKLASFVPFHMLVWDTLDKQIRSQEYQLVFGLGLNVLLNLAVYHKTVPNVWQQMTMFNGISVTFILMSKFVTYNPELFCKCCTLFWLLARIPRYAQALREYPNSEKQIMRFYTRLGAKPSQNKKTGAPMPSTVPQFGGYTKKPRFFSSQLHGLDSLVRLMNLQFQ